MFGDRASHSPRLDMMHFRNRFTTLYDGLENYLKQLDEKNNLPQYVEFTVENGVLYILTSIVADHNMKFPGGKDSRYVTYFPLLEDIQNEMENEEEKKE